MTRRPLLCRADITLLALRCRAKVGIFARKVLRDVLGLPDGEIAALREAGALG